MKKKSSAGAWIAAVAVIVILGGIVLAVGQDWKTGQNSVVEVVKAQLGDPEALYAQGVKAQKTKGGLNDPRNLAIPWFEKAAAKGHVKSMLALGDIYNTSAAEIDGDKAVIWYEKAAQAGNIEAKRKLAIALGIGRGSQDPNNDKALPWIRAAAEGGDGIAQRIYGDYLARTGHVNEGEALMLRAAAQNVEDANATLGAWYYDSNSPLHDYAKAFIYLGKAAEDGDLQSRLNYSYMYFSGRATAKDLAEAYKWALIAADSGKLDARRVVDFLDHQITPAEQAEGRTRADAWRKAHPKTPEGETT